VVAIKRKHTDI